MSETKPRDAAIFTIGGKGQGGVKVAIEGCVSRLRDPALGTPGQQTF